MFHLFPEREPLALSGGATGPLVPFGVPIEATEAYVRVIALWRDDLPLGGRAPTFELKSGRGGELAGVEAGGARVEVRAADGDVAGVVTARRLPADCYLVTLSELAEDAEPWFLRITNNDAETLRFAWVSAGCEDETLQPWMALDRTPVAADGFLPVSADGPEIVITVRNWGTGPLVVGDRPGARLGAERSPLTLLRRPDVIGPHGTDELVATTGPVAFCDRFSHTFETNDTSRARATLCFEVLPRSGPREAFDEPAFCRACGWCPDYAPHDGPADACRTCGHPGARHFDLPPDHRNV